MSTVLFASCCAVRIKQSLTAQCARGYCGEQEKLARLRCKSVSERTVGKPQANSSEIENVSDYGGGQNSA